MSIKSLNLSSDRGILNIRSTRRKHTKSIFNEMKLTQKIKNQLLNEQRNQMHQNINFAQIKNKHLNHEKRFSQTNNLHQFIGSLNQWHRKSAVFQLQSLDRFQNKKYKKSRFLTLPNEDMKKDEVQKQKQSIIIKKRNIRKKKMKQKNQLLSSINTKIRQIDLISNTFDKVNQTYNHQKLLAQNKYNQVKKTQTVAILKQFEQKLTLRKNIITERRNSTKQNTQLPYKFKIARQKSQNQQFDKQKQNHQQNQYKGLWLQNAKKIKKYITGGYLDEHQQFSDYCNLEEFKKLKKNFLTFQQIYNSIKQDKENPIGKITYPKTDNPNLLQLVCKIQKQQQTNVKKTKFRF